MRGSGAALVATDLVTGFRARGAQRVVTRASFRIDAGTIVALVGPNGAGKTTLLKTLADLHPPLGGTITVGGVAPGSYRERFGIGYLPEVLSLPSHWTGRGLLRLARLASGVATEAGAAEATRVAGVDFDLGKPVAELSKGMRQRLALAMALVSEPDVLLLDEPESGLDPGQRIRLRERLVSFARTGRIVVIASHDVSGACLVADSAYLLSGGGMQSVGRADLTSPDRLLRLFSDESVQ